MRGKKENLQFYFSYRTYKLFRLVACHMFIIIFKLPFQKIIDIQQPTNILWERTDEEVKKCESLYLMVGWGVTYYDKCF